MLKDIKLKTPRTVSFRTHSFVTPITRRRTQKHTITPILNTGFNATHSGLSDGYSTNQFSITTDSGNINFPNINNAAIKKIYCFPTHQNNTICNALLIVTQTGSFCVPLFASLPVIPIPNSAQFGSFECFAHGYSNGKDYVFASNNDGIFSADFSLQFKPLGIKAPARTMLTFDTRLFIVDQSGKQLHFSSAFDLNDFDPDSGSSGSINLGDDFNQLIGLDIYQGKLLLIFQYGLTLLETAHDPSNFRLAPLCKSYQAIIPNTTRTLGDVIYFLTRAGVCRVTGGRVTLLDIKIPNAAQPDATATIHDNQYFLAFKCNEASSTNDALLVIDEFLNSQTLYPNISIRQFQRAWSPFETRLALLTDNPNEIQMLTGDAENTKTWESDFFALTYAANSQFLRAILIQTKTPLEIFVINNRGAQQRISLGGSDEIQRTNLNFRGELFKIKIIATGTGVDISSLSAVIAFGSGI
jgi:hypothetical protein